MTTIHGLAALFLSLVFLQVQAQNEIPKGFKKGTLILADSSKVSGYIKDNIRNDAAVTLVAETGGKKKNYSGTELLSAELDATKYICISGDFFKILCEGDLCFLQKASDAAGKPSYNGAEAVFTSGTEGKPSDYFIYDTRSKALKLITKKNINEVASSVFAGNSKAIDKAKLVNGDLAQLKDAVEEYNNGK